MVPSLPLNLNYTHIVLIPKCANPESITQFRQIRLCNVVYKIISEVIVNRLTFILPHIITETRGAWAFVPGRLNADNVLVAFEINHFLKCKKWGKMGHVDLKLDMSEAYDRVEWVFLENLMRIMGFDERWIGLIMHCINTVSYSVVPNNSGGPKNFVQWRREILLSKHR